MNPQYMNDAQLQYVINHVIDSGNATLLIGKQSDAELRELYKIVKGRYPSYLVEDATTETEFWLNLLQEIKGETGSLELDVAKAYAECALKETPKTHIFIPNIDRIFYKIDIQQYGLLGATLRRIWQAANREITIFGSVPSKESEFYQKTLERYEYPFYQHCWLQVYVD